MLHAKANPGKRIALFITLNLALVSHAIACPALPEADARKLTLAAVEARLAPCNPEVIAAGRAVEAAGADLAIAGQGVNPNLTVQLGGVSPQLGVGGGSPRDKTVDTMLRLEQLVERGGKRELRLEAGQRLLDASRAEFADVLRRQKLALAQLFYDLALAQEKARLTRESAGLYEKTTAAAQLRFKAGDIAEADIHRIRLDGLRADNEARQAEAERKRAQAALAQAIGAASLADSLGVETAWPSPGQQSGGDVGEEELRRRPDLLALQHRVDAAQSMRALARSLATRDVTVGLQFDHYPVSEANPAGSGNTFGVSASLPLFARHGFEGEQRRAEVDFHAAQDAFAKGLLAARGDLVRVSAELGAAAERAGRFDGDILPTAEKVAAAAEFAYAKGASGVLDLLDARRGLRQVRLDAATARADYARAWASWRSASNDQGKK